MWQKMSVLESESAEDTVGSQPPASSGESRARGCWQGGGLLQLREGEARAKLRAVGGLQAKGQDTGRAP